MRFNSTRISGVSGSDPLRAARVASRTAANNQQFASAALAVEDANAAELDREARLWTRVERARIDREMGASIEQVQNTMPEGGAGFADLAISEYDARVAEARRRAGNDPRKLKYLEEATRVDREQQLGLFQKHERDAGREYAYDQHLLALDDARQRVGRMVTAGSEPLQADTLALIREKEGFRDKPYWDVNALRAGYGSDTVTRADGTVEKVGKNTRVTREDAERDLQRRVGEFQQGIIGDIGAEAWAGMTTSQQAALTSIAYNYGSLPDRVTRVIKAGGDVPAAIRSLGGDNDGVNASRREREANIYATGYEGGTDRNGVPVYTGKLPSLKSDPVFADALNEAFAQIDAMSVPETTKTKLKRQAEAELTTAALKTMGENNAPAALALLRSGDLDRVLSYKQTEAFEDDIRGQIEKAVSDSHKSQAAEFKATATAAADDRMAWFNNGMEGDAPPLSREQFDVLTPAKQRDVQEAFWSADAVRRAETVSLNEAGALLDELRPSGEGYSQEKVAFDAAKDVLEERFEADRINSHIEGSRAAGMIPNVGDKDVRDEIGARFEKTVAGSERPISDALGFVRDMQVVPDAFNDMAASIMGGENAEAKASLVNAIGDLHDENPELLARGGGRAVDTALALDSYVRAGLSFEEAEKLAREVNHPRNEAVYDARNKAWTADSGAMEDDAFEAFQATLNEEAKADLPPTARAEYMALAREKYAVTGNLDVAVRLAGHAFLKRHGVTHVGGKRWSRNPPEARYSVYQEPEKNAAWIEEQAMEFASEDFPDAEKVTLIAADERTGSPSYRLMVFRNGTVEEHTDLFTPDRAREVAVYESAMDRQDKVQSKAAEIAVQKAEIRAMQMQSSGLFDAVQEAARQVDLEGADISILENAVTRYQDHLAEVQEMRGNMVEQEESLLEAQGYEKTRRGLRKINESPAASNPSEPDYQRTRNR